MLLETRRYQVGRDGGFWIADVSIGTRRDGGFSIGHAARNGTYKTKATLVVDLRAYVAGVRALNSSGAKYEAYTPNHNYDY